MPVIQLDKLQPVKNPELIFGFVAPVGTPLDFLEREIEEILKAYEYSSSRIRLSRYLDGFELPTKPVSSEAGDFARLNNLMTRGNELRQALGGGDALAALAITDIYEERREEAPQSIERHAFLLHQLKHPDEVVLLRSIYGPAFHLIGVSCPEEERLKNLQFGRSMATDEAERLIERDSGEDHDYGQKVTDTFYLSDVFVEIIDFDNVDLAKTQLNRYMRLLFGDGVITPTKEEYGMFMAASAALRSSDLSRQVGASILTESGELVSVGTNEVPAAGGGQYWPDQDGHRDFERGYDENAKRKAKILREIVAALDDNWEDKNEKERNEHLNKLKESLGSARVANLTEFGRAVHAEMEAILSAGRVGVSVKGCNLYSTTFPCHNCAKHIVNSGINKVVYVEPYPKSLASELHGDAIAIEEKSPSEKVNFKPFVGVAPRKYRSLFSMMTPNGNKIRRKDKKGDVISEPHGLVSKVSYLNHVERESIALAALDKLTTKISQTEDTDVRES